jgi:hypothetical protein
MSDDYNPYASPQTPYSADMGRGLGVGDYEFSPSQSELIRGLAFRMKFVGWATLIVGLLALVVGILTLTIGAVIQAAVGLVLAGFTLAAAAAFTKIVTTRGSDIRHLMDALRSLSTLYSVQMILIIVGLVFIVLAIVLVAGGGLGPLR